MSPPLVSILMPVFNGEKYISQTIESVLSQTYKNYEIIIVNDGSTDHSYQKIKPYLRLSHLKYIEQDNAGVASARNAALQLAKGNYFALLDQDDLWHPEKLTKQIDLFKSNPKLGLVHCHAVPINATGEILPANPWWPRPTPPRAFEEIFLANPIHSCTAVFCRTALEQIGGFDPSPAILFADEYDLWLRIAATFEVGYIPETLSYYRLHSENNSRDTIRMITSTLNVLKKTQHDFPEQVSCIQRQNLRKRYAYLYLNLAEEQRRTGMRLHGITNYLKAAIYAPRFVLWRLIGEKRRNLWEWYKKRLFNWPMKL
ncbi:hypothetical protein JCM13664_02970 [Methylothermus subterraneus]